MKKEEIEKIVEFIKGKSEKVTPHLWYVSNELLEDVVRFFDDEQKPLTP